MLLMMLLLIQCEILFSLMLLLVKLLIYSLLKLYLFFSIDISGVKVLWVLFDRFGFYRQNSVVSRKFVMVSMNVGVIMLCSVKVIGLWNFLFRKLMVFLVGLQKLIMLVKNVCVWFLMVLCVWWLVQLVLYSIGLMLKKLMVIDGMVSRISGRVIIYGVLCGLCGLWLWLWLL